RAPGGERSASLAAGALSDARRLRRQGHRGGGEPRRPAPAAARRCGLPHQPGQCGRGAVKLSCRSRRVSLIDGRFPMKRLAIAFAVLLSAPAYAAKPMSCESLTGLRLPDTTITQAP